MSMETASSVIRCAPRSDRFFRSPPDRRVWNRRRAAASASTTAARVPTSTGPVRPILPRSLSSSTTRKRRSTRPLPTPGTGSTRSTPPPRGTMETWLTAWRRWSRDSSSTRRWRGPTARPASPMSRSSARADSGSRTTWTGCSRRPSTRGTRSVPRERRSARSRPGRTTASRTGAIPVRGRAGKRRVRRPPVGSAPDRTARRTRQRVA